MKGVTLTILAGGQSQRMGTAKSHLALNGQPILKFLLERLQWRGETILSTAAGREHPPCWEMFDKEIVDAEEDCGPLMGIISALKAARTNRVVFLPVDMPLVQREQIEFLVTQADGRGTMLMRNDRVEPFPCILDRAIVADLERNLLSGNRSVKGIAKLQKIALVAAPPSWPEAVWMNINTPDDLRGIESMLR